MSTTASPPVVSQPLPVGREPRRLQHLRLSAAVAAVVGVLSTAVGAGIGVRHVMKTGLTATSVLGLALLAIGLALLTFAAVVAWRALHRWQRLWLLPITLVSLLVIWPVAEGTMLGLSPGTTLDTVTPAARGLAYSDVTFATSDGIRLSGWYLPSTNHAAVVAVPGAGSTRTGTLDQAAVLARHGYGVLTVDPRGQGRSGGRAMDAGWYGDRDITAAVAFLQRQPGVDPSRIGVLGLSMGGEEAIGAAAADPAIRAVVAEGATHRTAADKAGYLPGGITGALQRGIDKLTYGVAALFSSAPEPRTLHSAITRAPQTPFLLIGGGNAIDEPEAVAYLHTAAPDRVQTWAVPDSSHTQALATARAEWTARVTAFLDRALGVSGS
jgi:dienelactone hydrolase